MQQVKQYKLKIMKTRMQAAKELLPLYNSMEVRKVKLSTIYRKTYQLCNGNWHCIGSSYDYTV